MNTPSDEPSNSRASNPAKGAAAKAKPASAAKNDGDRKTAAKTLDKKNAVRASSAAQAPTSVTKPAQSAQKVTTQPAVKSAQSAPAASGPSAGKANKTKDAKKEKVVRDSFTMPKSDYAKIASLKHKCTNNGRRVKKSEILRAALAVLDAAPEKRLMAALDALETVKTGRPSAA